MRPRSTKNLLLAITCVAASLILYDNARAESVLNFSAQTPLPDFSGNVTNETHGTTSANCQNGTAACTRFIYERVTDNGVNYYHMVLGCTNAGVCDPSFAQDVYIQVGTTSNASGGQSLGNIGPDSASGGAGQAGSGNSLDPLGVVTSSTITGNSSANPTRVEMRQIMNDGQLSTDFVKGKYAEKPTIVNSVTSSDFNATFRMDGTGTSYSTTTPAQVTNTIEVRDPSNNDAVVSSFDTATDSQQPHVTAGQYTYTPGTGSLGSRGTYNYVEGGANINPTWSVYFDNTQPNPWGYTTNRP